MCSFLTTIVDRLVKCLVCGTIDSSLKTVFIALQWSQIETT